MKLTIVFLCSTDKTLHLKFLDLTLNIAVIYWSINIWWCVNQFSQVHKLCTGGSAHILYIPSNHLSLMADLPECTVFNMCMCTWLIASACGYGGHGPNCKYGIVSYPSNESHSKYSALNSAFLLSSTHRICLLKDCTCLKR